MKLTRILLAIPVAISLLLPQTSEAQPSSQFVPVTDEMLQNPAPEDW